MFGPSERSIFFARWWALWWGCCRGRPVARRVLCVALGAALCVRCGVPDAVLFARFAAPDGAPSQTSARLRVASWAWRVPWWSGLPPLTSPKLRARPQGQTQPRIQGKQVRCDDRPVSAPNIHSFSRSQFAAPSEHVTNVERLVIDLDQLADQAKLEFPPTELPFSDDWG